MIFLVILIETGFSPALWKTSSRYPFQGTHLNFTFSLLFTGYLCKIPQARKRKWMQLWKKPADCADCLMDTRLEGPGQGNTDQVEITFLSPSFLFQVKERRFKMRAWPLENKHLNLSVVYYSSSGLLGCTLFSFSLEQINLLLDKCQLTDWYH